MPILYNVTEGVKPLPYELLCRTEGVHLPPKTSDSASFAAGHEAQPYVGVSKPAPVFLNQGSNGQEWPVSIPYKGMEGD